MRVFNKISLEQFKKDVPLPDAEALYEDLIEPKRQTASSAGYDICTAIDFIIEPGETKLTPTGYKVNMESNDVFFILIRSSIGITKNLIVPNSVGVIDADYYNNQDNEGHFWVALTNIGKETQEFKAGNRIAQGIFLKYNKIDKDSTSNELRTGGFGSTNE